MASEIKEILSKALTGQLAPRQPRTKLPRITCRQCGYRMLEKVQVCSRITVLTTNCPACGHKVR